MGEATYAGPRYGNPFDDPRYGLYKTDRYGYWVPVRSEHEDVNKEFTNKFDTAVTAPPRPPQFPGDFYAYPAYYEARKSMTMPMPYDYEARGTRVFEDGEAEALGIERPERRTERAAERLSRLSRPPSRATEERATAAYNTRVTTQPMGRASRTTRTTTQF